MNRSTSSRLMVLCALLLPCLSATAATDAPQVDPEASAKDTLSPVTQQDLPPERVEAAGSDASDTENPQRVDQSGSSGQDFDEGALGFAVQFGDLVTPFAVFSVFVMPGEAVEFETLFTGGAMAGELTAAQGRVERLDDGGWRWVAPQRPGHVPLTLAERPGGATMRVNAFVKVPYDPQQPLLDDYRIGAYQAEPLRGNPRYTRPEGFVRLTEDNRGLLVAPHFKLGQFQSKQGGDRLPKYLLVSETLLLKLEMILQAINEAGIDAETIHVMSAFRTPHYNRAIGNTTVYSRHLYGDAADIFVDTDKNGYMDDLDGDGEITRADAQYLADIVESQTGESWYRPLVGGLGVYGAASHRGPFIHVDTRGTRARW